MPYVAKGKCVYKKHGGAKVGCTKGSTKKYLAALHANVKENVFNKMFDEVLTEKGELSEKTKQKRQKAAESLKGIWKDLPDKAVREILGASDRDIDQSFPPKKTKKR